MAEVLEVLGSVLGSVLGALVRFRWTFYISRVFSILIFPLKAVSYPLSYIFRILLIIFAPIIYPFSYIFSWIRTILGLFAGLAPLYTFFGVAAFVGVVTGLVLAVFSSYLSSILGMQDSPFDEQPSRGKMRYLEEDDDVDEEEDDGLGRDESSSGGELELKWFESTSARRRPASGLLSQIIHEELDSSE
ncbi:unnamed protein product [Clonostachys rhizophaga]|uniref:Uncharacterized protein n=1 Tax=Clonostachys rhizophaga TaxID=160324 RepID=A0A9N9VKP6_9HYPO|nr:unnamed protein product [Clonostachys rhizophaga]